jgi:hypothetical protein
MHIQNKILHCKICDNGIGRMATSIKEETRMRKKSLGINLTQHRLKLINPTNQGESEIEIHNLINEDGYNSGTCVHIKIRVKEI